MVQRMLTAFVTSTSGRSTVMPVALLQSATVTFSSQLPGAQREAANPGGGALGLRGCAQLVSAALRSTSGAARRRKLLMPGLVRWDPVVLCCVEPVRLGPATASRQLRVEVSMLGGCAARAFLLAAPIHP
jgi:hypothetical protein